MTAKKLLYKIKDKYNIGIAWQTTEHVIIEAMEKYAEQQVKNYNRICSCQLGEQFCQHSSIIDPKVCIYDCTDCPITEKKFQKIIDN